MTTRTLRIALVTGGRKLTIATERVYIALDTIYQHSPFDLLIHGGATGIDREADTWARRRGIVVGEFKALWKIPPTQGDPAGPIRNAVMLDLRPQLVIAFPGGTGTANCIAGAKGRGLKVIEVPL